MKTLLVLMSIFAVCNSYAQESVSLDDPDRVEIKLVDALDEPRSWCVDLFAHRQNALPLGGFQGHNCFLYMGLGPTEDQGFDAKRLADGQLYLVYWDVCVTLHDPNPGSFVAAEACNDGEAQQFDFRDDGQIVSQMAPNLCLTMGATTVPGGGRLAPVGARPPADNVDISQIRRLTFENCEADKSALQRWELRNGDFQTAEPTQALRFLDPE
ncbi:MAG: RICIN domain-containing protein [Proteobacteria bacterium]|jgi:hypothetical protein|nr:RICIN domain-containing protein [Pseudomonadota bacterium]